MSKLLKPVSLAFAVLFVGGSLVIGTKSASAQGSQFICHSIEPSLQACISYCMATYGDDYQGQHWNPDNGCCQCIF